MHCLLVGSTGMLGQQMARDARARGWRVTTVARAGGDIAADLLRPESVLEIRPAGRIDVVINCAALTDIDECERNLPAATQVNATTPSVLAKLAERQDAYFIHVSTDHFFSGDGQLRHWESDPVTLVNNYAKTKLLGERLALNYQRTLVVRTNIMGFRLSPQRNTFLEWALRELWAKREFMGYDDFYTSGMPSAVLSEILCELAEGQRPEGRWNIAGRDVFSKRELIVALAKAFGLGASKLGHASVRKHGGVRRAESLGLETGKIEELLGRPMPGMAETISRIYDEYRGSNEIQKFIQNS